MDYLLKMIDSIGYIVAIMTVIAWLHTKLISRKSKPIQIYKDKPTPGVKWTVFDTESGRFHRACTPLFTEFVTAYEMMNTLHPDNKATPAVIVNGARFVYYPDVGDWVLMKKVK